MVPIGHRNICRDMNSPIIQPGWLTPLCDQLSLHSEPYTFKLLTSYFQFSSCCVETLGIFFGNSISFFSFLPRANDGVASDPQTGEVRHISHLNFVAWPDHDTPSQPDDLLTFISYMRHVHKAGPIITHCSAGIGRSGTLICIDVVLGLISRDLDVSIPGDGPGVLLTCRKCSLNPCNLLKSVPCCTMFLCW